MACFTIENLSFQYPSQKGKALDSVHLQIEEGAFTLLCGPSGGGKSTLLRLLKPEIAPHGKQTGKILYGESPINNISANTLAAEIGFVMQNPENQIVTDKVWHELAFGLESLGESKQVIRRRVAEMASYFGIQDWFRKDVHSLSGGQKQLLNLASVMAMQPKVLLLDEPTAQLDPIAAADFLETIRKINRDFSVTILLSEHRLEEIFPVCDKVAVLEQGRIAHCESPKKLAASIAAKQAETSIEDSLPTPARIYIQTGLEGECPLTIRDGRRWLAAHKKREECSPPAPALTNDKKPILTMKNVWFRYGKKEPDVLRGVSAEIFPGEIVCILGGNGSGKSTTLQAAAGLSVPYRGNVVLQGKKISLYKQSELYPAWISALPQNPQILFTQNTVEKDLLEMVSGTETDKQARVQAIAAKLNIQDILQQHPYDLSGGEQQKAAFAKVLLNDSSIIFLDEPTKGLDASFKKELAAILLQLKKEGKALVLASHDIEFAAEYADKCALFFDGEILSIDDARSFFSGNSYYTTAANRMARQFCQNAITCEDVCQLCR